MWVVFREPSSRNTDSSDKQKNVRGEIFKNIFAPNIDYCVFTIHGMFWLRTGQIILEQLSDPLLLLIFELKSLFLR